MEHYRARKGVVLTGIADGYFLVAAKALLGECPYVTEINESSAFLWKRLCCGASRDDLVDAVAREYEMEEDETARSAINVFIRQMQELNYIVEEGDQL